MDGGGCGDRRRQDIGTLRRAISDPQSHYFLDAIAANWGVRQTLLFVHKPVWEREDNETSGPIEAARSEVSQTVLNGHEHIDLHRQQDGRDCIRLVSTSGEQFPDKRLS